MSGLRRERGLTASASRVHDVNKQPTVGRLIPWGAAGGRDRVCVRVYVLVHVCACACAPGGGVLMRLRETLTASPSSFASAYFAFSTSLLSSIT